MTRILVYTGKGGVGKTSIAAATALACADLGYRTIVMSTDIAHSLGDTFEIELGPKPIEVVPNLWAQESDVFYNVARYWGRIQHYAASVLRWRGLDEVMAEEMTVLPGMDEVGSLLWIADHHDSGDYDVVVVDAAPTGETLRLLSLPEAAKWWMEKVEPIGRRITKLTGPLIQRVLGMPMPSEDVFNAGEELFESSGAHAQSAGRSFEDLGPGGADTRAGRDQGGPTLVHVLPSLQLPDRFGGCKSRAAGRGRPVLPWLVRRTTAVRANRREDVPSRPGAVGARTSTARWSGSSDCGSSAGTLRTMIRPSSSIAVARTRSGARNGTYTVSVDLPFTEKTGIDLSRHGDELVIDLGSYRRTLVLPRILVDVPTAGATFEGGTLKIRFATQSRSEENHRDRTAHYHRIATAELEARIAELERRTPRSWCEEGRSGLERPSGRCCTAPSPTRRATISRTPAGSSCSPPGCTSTVGSRGLTRASKPSRNGRTRRSTSSSPSCAEAPMLGS